MKNDIDMNNSENQKESFRKPFPYNFRKWIPQVNIDAESNDCFRVMSYNILSDSLLSISTNIKESELNKMPYLQWNERRQRLLNEIALIKPDIVCLQELEKDEIFFSEFGKLNYDVWLIIYLINNFFLF